MQKISRLFFIFAIFYSRDYFFRDFRKFPQMMWFLIPRDVVAIIFQFAAGNTLWPSGKINTHCELMRWQSREAYKEWPQLTLVHRSWQMKYWVKGIVIFEKHFTTLLGQQLMQTYPHLENFSILASAVDSKSSYHLTIRPHLKRLIIECPLSLDFPSNSLLEEMDIKHIDSTSLVSTTLPHLMDCTIRKWSIPTLSIGFAPNLMHLYLKDIVCNKLIHLPETLQIMEFVDCKPCEIEWPVNLQRLGIRDSHAFCTRKPNYPDFIQELFISTSHIFTLPVHLCHLTTLVLMGNWISNEGLGQVNLLIHQNAQTLTDLSLDIPFEFTKHPPYFPHLIRLTINFMNPTQMDMLPMAVPCTLQLLDIGSKDSTPVSFQWMSKLTHLKTMILHNVHFTSFAHLKSLKTLSLNPWDENNVEHQMEGLKVTVGPESDNLWTIVQRVYCESKLS